MTPNDLQKKKDAGQKISMLTAYDYPTAHLVDQSGVDIILVGDSLANVVLGLGSTAQIGMMEMLHHSKAVSRAVKHALVVGDMPFDAYQVDTTKALANAQLFITEAKCQAVKLEWFKDCAKVAQVIADAGIAVMGHVGLTPQTVEAGSTMKVQGKNAENAKQILKQAQLLQDAGCFAIVLECIPQELAKKITAQLKIPTIGIGAGPFCDGQVLVSHDVLGLTLGHQPKFSKKYADLGASMLDAFKKYKQDVTEGRFPDQVHSFHMPADEIKKLQ